VINILNARFKRKINAF